ncbi:MAG: phosphoribosylglycinamide formyltransferase [Pseudomonadota bacterium]
MTASKRGLKGDTRKRVAVMISGRGSNLGALISATMAKDYPCRIVAAISDRPDVAGLKLAKDHAVETYCIDRKDYDSRESHEDAILGVLESIKPDLICLAGYMRLLSPAFVQRWRGLMINIHPSLLPSFPGLETHQRVLTHQVRLHGCSVHFVTERMDEGPLIAQAAVPVLPDDTVDRLAARVLRAEHRLYPASLRLVAEDRVRITDSGTVIFNRFPAADDRLILYSNPVETE